MRISDWSSDVCSSDLIGEVPRDDLHLKTQIRITLDISVVTWWKPQHHAALFFWTVPQHRHVVRGPRLELVALGRGGLRVERGLFLLDLPAVPAPRCLRILAPEREGRRPPGNPLGHAPWRERVCQYGVDLGGRRSIKKKNTQY